MTTPMHSGLAPYRTGARLGNQPGGVPVRHPRAAPAPGQVDTRLRAPNDTAESALLRDRTPWIKQPAMVPPGYGAYQDWSGQGNIRPSLLMRDVTYARMQGTSNTRAQDPIPTGYGTQLGTGEKVNRQLTGVPTNSTPHGMHSRVIRQATALDRSRKTPQQRAGRQTGHSRQAAPVERSRENRE